MDDTRYQWGKVGPAEFDCSGLVRAALEDNLWGYDRPDEEESEDKPPTA